ncbi:MAG: hypothetical protein VYD75_10020 [Pseudomonadota bacterium]|nr:hypothetical protein [Pseudomonadota bacterium]
MKSYRVFAKREEYYVHDVEANSLEEAQEKVQQMDDDGETWWEPLLDGGEFEIFSAEEAD